MRVSGPVPQAERARIRSESDLGAALGLILFVILIAFGVRTWGLGAQSIWLDEGISIHYAMKPLGSLIASVIADDIHPPLYYVALHFWMVVSGSSEYAIRFLSAAVGLLAVPAMYQLARSLLRLRRAHSTIPAWSGVAAGLLAAISPFMVYYSQEARNYGMVTVWTILASLALWKAQETSRMRARSGPQVRWWLAYVLFATLTIYTHYFGAFLLMAHVLYLAITSIRVRRFPIMGAASLFVTGVLYLPWLGPGLAQMLRMNASPDFWAGTLSIQSLLERLFVAFALGPKAESVGMALAAFGVLLAVGIVTLVRVKDAPVGRGEVFLFLYLFVPLSIMYAITARAPKFAERYVIMAAPAFYLLLARGLTFPLAEGKDLLNRGKRRGWPLIGFFVAVSLAIVSFSGYYTYTALTSPEYARDNNRAAVRYIEANSRPGDVIIFMMSAPQAFEYYYTGDLPWYGLQTGDNFAAAASELNRITQGKDRAWLYLWNQDWADPAGFVLDSLEDAGPRVLPDKSFQGVQVRLYSLAGRPAFSADFHPIFPLSLNFENKVQLLGFDPPSPSQAASRGNEVTLYWKALQPLGSDHVVSLRLKRDGQYWGHREVRPTSYFYPTTSWKVGLPVRGRIAVAPLPGTPPGEYQVEVAFHDLGASGEGRDLSLVGPNGAPRGTSAIIGTIQLAGAGKPASIEELGLENPQPSPMRDGVSLLGAQTVARSLKPGDTLPLTLFWTAADRPREANRVLVWLEDSQGRTFTLYEGHPAGGAYPTERWKAGEVVRDQYSLPIPGQAAAGPAIARVALAGASGAQSPPATIAKLDVQERRRAMERPENIQHTLSSNLENTVKLAGYDLSSKAARPGETLRLVLYWQAARETRTSYTVFAHLLDAQNKLWGQRDNAPVGGTYFTSAWVKGEFVRDEYDLTVSPDAPPGDYMIEIGMYDATNGLRLKVLGDDGQPQDDRVILGRVRVGP